MIVAFVAKPSCRQPLRFYLPILSITSEDLRILLGTSSKFVCVHGGKDGSLNRGRSGCPED